MEIIDINNWERQEIFDFFSNYSNPYMGFIFKLDVTNIVEDLNNNKKSFYGVMTYLTLKSMSDIEAFKYSYRMNEKLIKDNVVCKYDNLIVSNTILRNDSTFNFSDYIPYTEDINKFLEDFTIAKNNVINNTKTRKYIEGSTVYITCVPWFDFTSYFDAYMGRGYESSPKICWGKFYNENGRYYLHYSLSINHAFQDGLHIGQFYNNLQENINEFKLSQKKVLLKNGNTGIY